MSGEKAHEKELFENIGKSAAELVNTFRRLEPVMDKIFDELERQAQEFDTQSNKNNSTPQPTIPSIRK